MLVLASSLGTHIGYGIGRRFFQRSVVTDRGTAIGRRQRLVVEMKGKGGPKQPAYQLNSDGTRVLDRGVWKEFKVCTQCQRIFVNRKAFEKNWSEVKYCSSACRSKSKSSSRKHTGEATDADA